MSCFQFLTHVDGLVDDMNRMDTMLNRIKDWHSKIVVEPGDHPGKLLVINVHCKF